MVSRGEIYFVDLDPTKGREQAGRQPVLVVSHDAINRQPLVITIVVGTNSDHVLRDYPTNVRLKSKDTGLKIDTVFLCFQIRSLDRKRLFNPKTGVPELAGKVPPEKMHLVDQALRQALAL